MKILLAATEMAPLARTGGLGDVLDALPGTLAAAGHEVSVVLPCFRGLREDLKLGAVGTGVAIPIQVAYKEPTELTLRWRQEGKKWSSVITWNLIFAENVTPLPDEVLAQISGEL